MAKSELVFEKLTRSHDRKNFDCGNFELNEFLKKAARQNIKKNLGITYVLTDSSKTIYGFYTIAASAVAVSNLPEELRSALPGYPEIPAFLIARLAVDKEYSGKGLGETILMRAFQRILEISDKGGVHLITVEAKDEKVVPFYSKYGFEPVPSNSKYLFIPVNTVKKAFSNSKSYLDSFSND